MCDVDKLRGKIVEKRMTQQELAEKVGISKSTLNRKLKNGDKITIEEANKITRVLGLTKEEALSIFLKATVA